MTMPPKIGLLTFHRCINYGSYWQARCLVEGLRGRGHDAVLLDHHSPRVNRAEWRCAMNPTLPIPRRPEDRAGYRAKTRRFLAAFDRLPLSPAFDLDEPRLDPYDLLLVGSDEVWNPRHPWYGGCELFYGRGLDAPRLVAYAASFGNHRASDGLDAARTARLRRFAAISVRDDNSRALIRDLLGADSEMVLDPCLQFPEVARSRSEADADDIAVIYGHGFPAWFAARVRDWARKAGCRLVSVGYRNDWADEQRLDVGPEAFPDIVASSRAVATSFFHGCVFALLHDKPFACTASDYRANKVRSLVATVDARGRLITEDLPAAACAAALARPPGPAVAARIDALRTRSDAYLAHALAA